MPAALDVSSVSSMNNVDANNTRQDGESRAEVFALINSDGVVKATREYAGQTPDVIRIIRDECSDDVARALCDLALAAPKDYITPCRQNPEAWDAPRITRAAGPVFSRVVARVQRSCDSCLDCQVFVSCMNVAAANRQATPMAITGILAGELHDESNSGALVRSSMEEKAA